MKECWKKKQTHHHQATILPTGLFSYSLRRLLQEKGLSALKISNIVEKGPLKPIAMVEDKKKDKKEVDDEKMMVDDVEYSSVQTLIYPEASFSSTSAETFLPATSSSSAETALLATSNNPAVASLLATSSSSAESSLLATSSSSAEAFYQPQAAVLQRLLY